MPDTLIELRLTPSERMALLDIIAMVMHPPVQMEVFVDVARNVETTPEQLFTRVREARPTRDTQTVPPGELFLVWSMEHAAWWRTGNRGYTPNLREAGRLERARAGRNRPHANPRAAHRGALP